MKLELEKNLLILREEKLPPIINFFQLYQQVKGKSIKQVPGINRNQT